MKYIADLNQLHNFHTFVTLLGQTILKKKKVLQTSPGWLEGSPLIGLKFYICVLEGSTVTCLYCIVNGICIHSVRPYCISTFLTFLFVLLSLYLYHFKSCICVTLYFDLFHICIHVALYFYPFDICICVILYFYPFDICICLLCCEKAPLDMPWRARRPTCDMLAIRLWTCVQCSIIWLLVWPLLLFIEHING